MGLSLTTMQGIRRDDGRPAAAAAGDGGGELGALHQLIPPQDHRLQRAVWFLALGFCILIYSTVPNHHSTDWELLFLGFFAFVGAAALMLFTLGGADARRVE